MYYYVIFKNIQIFVNVSFLVLGVFVLKCVLIRKAKNLNLNRLTQ